MNRIVCIGNRYVAADAAGPRVLERLRAARLPADTELVDGALAGLDLLPLLERSERVVFVDAVEGLAARVAPLAGEAVAALADPAYDHAAGLPWLLRAAPLVCDGPLADVTVVGVTPDADEADLGRAARLALRIAGGGGA